MIVSAWPDAESAADGAARFITTLARGADGVFSMAASGGKSPWRMYATLAQEPLDWGRFRVFQTDERMLPDGHPERNLTRLEAILPTVMPMPMAGDYDVGALDLVHLGLGPDGHCASLFPGDDDHAGRVATVGVHLGVARRTLTRQTLDAAKTRLWLVTGAEKREMLHRLLAADPTIPAGRITQRDSICFCDVAALRG